MGPQGHWRGGPGAHSALSPEEDPRPNLRRQAGQVGKARGFPEESAPEPGPEACMMAVWGAAAHPPKAPIPRKPRNHPSAPWPLLFGTQHSWAKRAVKDGSSSSPCASGPARAPSRRQNSCLGGCLGCARVRSSGTQLAWLHLCPHTSEGFALKLQSPTFLAPGTSVLENSFSTDWGSGGGARFQDDSISLQVLCTLFLLLLTSAPPQIIRH